CEELAEGHLLRSWPYARAAKPRPAAREVSLRGRYHHRYVARADQQVSLRRPRLRRPNTRPASRDLLLHSRSVSADTCLPCEELAEGHLLRSWPYARAAKPRPAAREVSLRERSSTPTRVASGPTG